MDKQQFQIVGIISWDKMLGYIQGWIHSTKGLPKIQYLLVAKTVGKPPWMPPDGQSHAGF